MPAVNTLLEMVSDGTLLYSRNLGIITYVNLAGATLLRKERAQVIGNNMGTSSQRPQHF